MKARLRAALWDLGNGLRQALRLLHACLRHLADEDAWERQTGRVPPTISPDAQSGSGTGAAGTGCGDGCDAGEGQGLDRGAFWQQETERRWNGVRRCC